MGQAKEDYLKNEERGFLLKINTFICEKHFEDSDILNYIKKNGEKEVECHFCKIADSYDENSNQHYKIDSNILLKGIIACIKRSFDDPANGLAFETKEGGYFGDTYTTFELLNDVIQLEADEEVVNYISDLITQDNWTEAEFYGDSYHEKLSHLWYEFSTLIKHKVRYLFTEVNSNSLKHYASNKPFDILNIIADFITKLNLVRTIPENTNLFNQTAVIYRARQHKQIDGIKTYKDIGSPPSTCSGANRFSAEGISMFYGAQTEATAIEEIINREKQNEYITVAKFYPKTTLNLIDLRNTNQIGFFDFENIDLFESSLFLSSFLHQVSAKLDPDQNKRIEYVPSQVVTEYFKHVLQSKLNITINGLVYKSVQNKGYDCYVIFAENEQCGDELNSNDETLLILKSYTLKAKKVLEFKTKN